MSLSSSAFAACGFVLLAASMAAWLGAYPLMQPDEGRNAEVAREMASSGDYVIPRLNGLPYIDKPLLYFATAAVSMRALGANEFGARFPSLLFTLVTAGVIAWFGGRVWGPQIGWSAAAIYLSSPLAFALSKTVILDSLFALLTVAALASLYISIENRAIENRAIENQAAAQAREGAPGWRGWSLLAWALIALGILTKGPVALLIALIVGAPYAMYRRATLAAIHPAAIALAVAIVTPWIVLMARAAPDYLRYVAVVETWQRVSSDRLRHVEPIWFFVPVLALGAFPWIFIAAAGLRRWWRNRRYDPRVVFLALWIVAPFVIFSLSRAKLPHYMLPLIPALAVLTAILVCGESRADPPGRTSAAVALCIIGLAGVAAPAIAGSLNVDPATIRVFRPFVWSAGVAALAAGAIALLLRPQGAALIAVFCIPMVVVGFASGPALQFVAANRSAKTLASAIRAHPAMHPLVVGVGAFPTSLPFYLGQPIQLSSAGGEELTSNYVRFAYAGLVDAPGSTLHGPQWWKTALGQCRQPTFFVIRNGDQRVAQTLIRSGAAHLVTDRKFTVYGPCRPDSEPPDQANTSERSDGT